ncbi:AAA family ATPase [Streptomyces caeni]|uniref:AAA family ATPase n=1 Tax=Streptomyces caeni TaxID=2307231 RepID=A0ABW4IM72_9ACTN
MNSSYRGTRPWPLIGRAGELGLFRQVLRRGVQHAFLVHGPAGVGKTRLAEECLAEAGKAGLTTARAVATSLAASIPLGALAHLLATDPGQPAAPVPPESSHPPPPERPEPTGHGDVLSLFARARQAVAAKAGNGRLVLLVDDLPLLDPLSLLLLGQLLDAGALFLVATVRDGEPVPDAMYGLWSGDRGVRVDLGPLDRAHTDELVQSLFDLPVGVAACAELWTATHGNLLYLRELLLSSVQEGTLGEVGGVLQFSRPPRPGRRLLDLVTARIRGVDPAGRAMLDLLALCQPLGVDELCPADREAGDGGGHGAGADHLDALERLEEAGLVQVRTAGRRHEAVLTHPLHAQVLRAELPVLRRRKLLLGQIARVESRGARRADDALRVAQWRLDATGTADPALLMRAARLARYAHDHPRVERLARGVLADRDSAEAGLLLGEALLSRGAVAEAEEALARAAELPCGDTVRLALVLARGSNLFWGLLRPDLALALADEARSSLAAEHHGELAALAAMVLTFTDQPQQALALLDTVPRGAGQRPTPLRALGESAALAVAGRTAEALTLVDEAEADARADAPLPADLFDFLHPSTRLMGRAIVLHESGRLPEASALMRRALRAAVDDGVPHALSTFAWYVGRCVLLEGRPRTAARWARDAVSISRARGFEAPLKLGLGCLALALSHLGDGAGARAAAAEMDTLHPPVDAQGLVPLARAWAAAAENDPATARSVLSAAAEDVRGKGQLTVSAALWHDVARLGNPAAAADPLARLSRECDSALVSARAAHARAAADRAPAPLAESAERFAQLGATLLAAEAAAAAADAWRAAGDQRAAAALAARSAELAARCEGAVTPALTVSTGVVPLTAREREICLLAVDGLSSKDIADRLTLSVRTVNNHLQNAYGKLGVGGRTELAAALERTARTGPSRSA